MNQRECEGGGWSGRVGGEMMGTLSVRPFDWAMPSDFDPVFQLMCGQEGSLKDSGLPKFD